MDFRDRLFDFILSRCLIWGDFTLASGLKSDHYFDCKRCTLHPEGLFLAAQVIFDAIQALDAQVEAVGGPTIGADPIVAAVSLVSRERGLPLPAFICRKEPKGHGTLKWIEGNLEPGTRVVILEDVVTTGASTLKAIRAAEHHGLKVVGVVGLVDRGEAKNEELKNYDYRPIFHESEFLRAKKK
jgi:orotate phosphoribosyltransferase